MSTIQIQSVQARQRAGLPVAIAVAILLLAGCAHRPSSAPQSSASTQGARPEINRQFLDADLNVERWVRRFESESREIYAHRHQIVEAIGLKAGQAVADIGAGSGLFSVLFAGEVGPQGTVYAVDISPGFVRHIEENARRSGLTQIRAILCEQDSIKLPPNSIDVAFVCDTYHHFEYPAATLASIHRALRPNGELVVIDFHRIPGTSSEWVMNHVRAGKEVFTAEIESAGFITVEELPIPQENYFLRFKKR